MKNLQNYPLNIDFTAAVQNPQVCFADDGLRSAQPAKNKARRILLWSGNFATVYKLLQGGQAWAVRCFTRQPQSDIKQRYGAISEYLEQHQLPYLVKFQFLEQGILVHGVWQPILKMDWVEGVDLDVYIGKNINDPKQLLHLERQLHQLRQDLHKAHIAHGDLQHGNVMVTTTGELKLVDYDGMYVPTLEGMPPHEMGHPNYQSPWRGEEDFHSGMDDFAFDVIALSLRALALEPSLWQQFHEDNKNLLFRQKDFQEPENSPVFQAIAQLMAQPKSHQLGHHKDHHKDHAQERELRQLYERVWRHCRREVAPKSTFQLSLSIPDWNSSGRWLWLAAIMVLMIIGGSLFVIFALMPGKSGTSNPSLPNSTANNPSAGGDGSPTNAATNLRLNRMALVEQYRAGKRKFGGVNLSGEDLSNLQLSGIELPGAQLERVNLQRTNLSQSNLTGANLHQSNLDKADLTSATLTDAIITDASLTNAQLSQAIALRTNFSQSKLSQGNMPRIDGTGAVFSGADLQSANLSQGNFTLSNFRKSKLIRTNLSGSILAGAEITDGNLNYADLTDADLRSTVFTNTNLNKANLTNSNLTNASLILVELAGANLTKANLRQINLQNIGSIEAANFTEVQFLSPKTRQALCTLASGTVADLGISTQASLGCP